MAFKLNKGQARQWDDYLEDLRGSANLLNEAIGSFNTAIKQAHDTLQDYVADYNQAIENAGTLVAELADEWQSQFDEKSDTWQESDKGQEIQEIISALQGFNPDDFELGDVTTLDTVEPDTAAEFESIRPPED